MSWSLYHERGPLALGCSITKQFSLYALPPRQPRTTDIVVYELASFVPECWLNFIGYHSSAYFFAIPWAFSLLCALWFASNWSDLSLQGNSFLQVIVRISRQIIYIYFNESYASHKSLASSFLNHTSLNRALLFIPWSCSPCQKMHF